MNSSSTRASWSFRRRQGCRAVRDGRALRLDTLGASVLAHPHMGLVWRVPHAKGFSFQHDIRFRTREGILFNWNGRLEASHPSMVPNPGVRIRTRLVRELDRVRRRGEATIARRGQLILYGSFARYVVNRSIQGGGWERSSSRLKNRRTTARMESQLEERREAEAHVQRVVKDLVGDLKHLMHMREGYTLEELQKDSVKGVVRGSIVQSIRDAVERADDSEAYQNAVIQQLQAVDAEESRRMDSVVQNAQQELSQVQERILEETVEGVREKLGVLDTELATERADTFEEIKSLFNLSYATCRELHENIIKRQQELVEQADKGTNALRLKAYARLAIILPHFPGFPPLDESSRQTGLEVFNSTSAPQDTDNVHGDTIASVATGGDTPHPPAQKSRSSRGKWIRRVGMVLLVPIGAFFATRRRSKTINRPKWKSQPKVSVKEVIPTIAPSEPSHPKVTLTERTDSAQVLRRKDLAQG